MIITNLQAPPPQPPPHTPTVKPPTHVIDMLLDADVLQPLLQERYERTGGQVARINLTPATHHETKPRPTSEKDASPPPRPRTTGRLERVMQMRGVGLGGG
jgi:hypothetical protein